MIDNLNVQNNNIKPCINTNIYILLPFVYQFLSGLCGVISQPLVQRESKRKREDKEFCCCIYCATTTFCRPCGQEGKCRRYVFDHPDSFRNAEAAMKHTKACMEGKNQKELNDHIRFLYP